MTKPPATRNSRTNVTPSSQPAAKKSRALRGGTVSSTKAAELEDAFDKREEAEASLQISNDKLAEQMAVTAEKDAKLAEMEAQLTAAKKAIADAETRRESSDGDGGIASGGNGRGAGSDINRGMASGNGSTKKKLPDGMKANLATHLTGVFRHNKFINNDMLEVYPIILSDAFEAMNLTTDLDRAIYGRAARTELKYIISQKRGYCKKRVMKRYKGKWK